MTDNETINKLAKEAIDQGKPETIVKEAKESKEAKEAINKRSQGIHYKQNEPIEHRHIRRVHGDEGIL